MNDDVERMVIDHCNGHGGEGFYVWSEEYPDEGSWGPYATYADAVVDLGSEQVAVPTKQADAYIAQHPLRTVSTGSEGERCIRCEREKSPWRCGLRQKGLCRCEAVGDPPNVCGLRGVKERPACRCDDATKGAE